MRKKVFEKKILIRMPTGHQEETYMRVFAPESENDTYFCVVEFPAVIKTPRKIFGVDANQAQELAIAFVNTLAEDFDSLNNKEGDNN